MELVAAAISAGIFNDLGSGSNVDVCVITKDKTDYLRNYERPNERCVSIHSIISELASPECFLTPVVLYRVQKEMTYKFKRGTTDFHVDSERIRRMVVEESITPFEASRQSSLPGKVVTAVDPPEVLTATGDDMDTS